MGLIYAQLKLINTFDLGMLNRKLIKPHQLKSIEITALMGSGVSMLYINEDIQKVLQLDEIGFRKEELENGDVIERLVVGHVEVFFQNRSTSCRAIVLPGNSKPLLGAIQMEDLDIDLVLKGQEIVLNPERPLMDKKRF